jgi:hypothetical protein
MAREEVAASAPLAAIVDEPTAPVADANRHAHTLNMSYGDDRPSSVQRSVALLTIVVALFVLSYGWLIAGMMATPINPSLLTFTGVLVAIIVGNGTLLFGKA